ncbi:MAG: serine/threonine protein kinase, partial [Planctomycetota bacterium]
MICPSCKAANQESAGACRECGRPLAAALPTITRGTVLASRYEIVSPLGRGGMGMVYKARDRVLEATVAIKTLRPEIAAEPGVAHRFMSEIKLARKVRHENVCAIHEYGDDGALRFIAMELVEGVEVRRILRERGRLPTDSAFEVTLQVGRGLQAIHEAGIVHRDLKTSNLMVDAHGLVRLMDFGIARQAGSEFTVAGQILGTPDYMSPEQAQGHRVDL